MLTFPLLTPTQCDAALELGASAPVIVRSGDRRLASDIAMAAGKGIRFKSSLAFLTLQDWLRQELTRALNTAAVEFGYAGKAMDLHDCTQQCSPRVATYDEGQSFGPHNDVPNPFASFPMPPIHWIACSVQLDDGKDYEGGDLLIETGKPGAPFAASRQRGHVTCLPAHVLHEVRPVTRGRRRALVYWGTVAMEQNVSKQAAIEFCERLHLFGRRRETVLALAED